MQMAASGIARIDGPERHYFILSNVEMRCTENNTRAVKLQWHPSVYPGVSQRQEHTRYKCGCVYTNK